MLTGTGLSDDLLLAHILSQQHLAHAMVELVGAGMVQVLTLGIQLHTAQGGRQTLQMGNRSGTALEFLADATQLCNEFPGLADGVISFGNFVHSLLQIRIHIRAAIGAKVTLLIGIISQVSFKIYAIEFHFHILRVGYSLVNRFVF